MKVKLFSIVLFPFGVHMSGFEEWVIFLGLLIAAYFLPTVVLSTRDRSQRRTLWVARVVTFVVLWLLERVAAGIIWYVSWRLALIIRTAVIVLLIVLVVLFVIGGKRR